MLFNLPLCLSQCVPRAPRSPLPILRPSADTNSFQLSDLKPQVLRLANHLGQSSAQGGERALELLFAPALVSVFGNYAVMFVHVLAVVGEELVALSALASSKFRALEFQGGR